MSRLFRFFWLVLHFVKAIYLFRQPKDNTRVIEQGLDAADKKKIKSWLQQVLSLCRIELIIHGDSVSSPKMIVANHVSWLDVVILWVLYPGHFIAKQEIANWPLLGKMIASAGTLFINRNKNSEIRRIASQLKQIIHNQQNVLFFPEGKTGDGSSIQKIHPALFQYAIEANMVIQPLLLVYEDKSGKPSTVTPYLNQQSLVSSIWKILGQQRIKVHCYLLPPVREQSHRKKIATQIQQQLQYQLETALNSTIRQS